MTSIAPFAEWTALLTRMREEVFGGIGQSWKGCFVGGRYLVLAVTQGEAGEKLCGNFPDYTQPPEPEYPKAS
jgi:hypothetical protein